MITDAFSPEKDGVLRPDMCYQKSDQSFDTLILTFSTALMEKLVKEGTVEKTDTVDTSINGDRMVYQYRENPRIGAAVIGIGAPHAVCLCEELAHITQANSFIVIGSCGSLDPAISAGKVIVPEKSWRDEGTSYHYMPASDWIAMNHAPQIEEWFRQWNVSCVAGPVWTTDALYRETASETARHKKDGCIGVDMEASALQAWADFRQKDFYTFFYSADSLDEKSWDPRILMSNGELDPAGALFSLAVMIAKELQKH